MSRVVKIAALTGALFVVFLARAHAMTEFCPASLTIKPVGAIAENQPSATYGFILKASGPRNVIATLTFDTDRGWFSVTTPAVALVEKVYRYDIGYRTAVRSDWNSPLMYVKFPSPVHLTNAWVSTANAQACSPSLVHVKPVNDPDSPTVHLFRDKLVTKDADQLTALPSSASIILSAAKTAPAYSATCATPFREAEMIRPIPPDPGNASHFTSTSGMSIVKVAIDPNGSLSDSWIWLSSGETAFDNALLWSAQHTQYKNAIAYCRPVPARYLIGLTFS